MSKLADHVASGDRGAFEDREPHPGPLVPEAPPPRRLDAGWDDFAPVLRTATIAE